MRIRLVEKTGSETRRHKLLVGLAGVAASLIVGALLILAGGASPLDGYLALFNGAFGSVSGIAETLVRMAPLLIISLGLTMAFKAGAWNIGAEGQFLAGALGATVVGLYLQAPFPIPLIMAMISGLLFGGLWGFVPGFLKARFTMNEILTTLMLNYVMSYFVSYLLYNQLMDPASVVPQTGYMSQASWLPRIIEGTRVNVGILITVALAILVFFVLKKTVFGYKLKAIRYTKAAKSAGMDVGRYVIIAMLLSGALAGLAGAVEVSGIHHRLRGDISPGFGFIGILIAVMGNLNPVWVTLVSFIYSGIMVGSSAMQITTGVHTSISFIFQGVIPIIFLIVRYLGQYGISFKGRKAEEGR